MGRIDNAHRAGGAAPTLAFGRPGTAGNDSGSVGGSPTTSRLTPHHRGQSINGTPPPARCGDGGGFPTARGGRAEPVKKGIE
eukprot:76571-Rhodomonas_salina.1